MSRLRTQFEFIHERGQTIRDVALVLSEASQRIDNYARDAVGEISKHIAGRAHLNAPIKTGLLRSRIRATHPRAAGGFTSRSWSSVVFVDNVRYAVVMHESLRPYGMVPVTHLASKSFYDLGPRSRIQPYTVEGGVGGRYVARIVEYHEQQYFDKFVIGLGILLGTGRSPGRLSFTPGYFRFF